MDRRDSKSLMVMLYMVAYGLLLSLYVYYVAPDWGYMGFELEMSWQRVVVGALVIVSFVLATPTGSNVRSFLLNLLLTIYLLPSVVLYACSGQAASSAVTIWSAVAIVYVVSALPLPRMYVLSIRTNTLMWGLAGATLCLLAAFYFLGGYRNFNLDIRAVYDFRRDAAAALPGIFGYLTPTFSMIVIPFGIAAALAHRKYTIVFVFCLASLLIFGFTSHRGILFTPLVVIGIYYFLRRFGRYSTILILFIAGLLAGQIDVLLASQEENSIYGWYTSLFIRRALLLPALIEYQYLELFSQEARYYWSHSRVTFGLVANPHGIVPPQLIGEIYYGSTATNANTGFIGSGYAQAGLWGTVIYSIGVGLIFAFFQSDGRYMGLPFVAAATSGLVLNIFATDFLTLFLTHGMLLLLALFTIVRSMQTEANEEAKRSMPVTGALQTG